MHSLPEGTVIRRAVPDDFSSFAAICRRTFADTFGYAHTDEELARHLDVAFSDATLAPELADPRRVVLAVMHDDTWLAYAVVKLGASTPSVVAQRPCEIDRFYVDRPWHGRGIAHTLMAEALRVIRDAGGDAAWLGVWEHNPRAIKFYERVGFRVVGAHTYLFDGKPENDHIMSLAL